MAQTVDFIHHEALADAILARIRNATNGLPARWRDSTDDVLGLKRIEFGRLLTWRFSGEEGDQGIDDLIPGVFVRFASSGEAADVSLIGGKEGEGITFSVVHVFGDRQCIDATDATVRVQPERAKAQKAEIISKAIYNDATSAYRRKLGNPTLTTDDTSAHVIYANPSGVVYDPPEDAGEHGIHAFACLVAVTTLTK